MELEEDDELDIEELVSDDIEEPEVIELRDDEDSEETSDVWEELLELWDELDSTSEVELSSLEEDDELELVSEEVELKSQATKAKELRSTNAKRECFLNTIKPILS